jgi:hypothetical protein
MNFSKHYDYDTRYSTSCWLNSIDTGITLSTDFQENQTCDFTETLGIQRQGVLFESSNT